MSGRNNVFESKFAFVLSARASLAPSGDCCGLKLTLLTTSGNAVQQFETAIL